MGFRSLNPFNQAIVAKQAWRILHYPDSFMAKVIKGKYYKNSSFLEAIAVTGLLLIGRASFGVGCSLNKVLDIGWAMVQIFAFSKTRGFLD